MVVKKIGRYPRREVVCPVCKKTRIITGFRKTNYCNKCNGKFRAKHTQTGSKNPNWKGGITKTEQGYIHITLTGIKNPQLRQWAEESNWGGKKAFTILKHRLLMIKRFERPLRKGEVVHHLNGDKTDNRLINLSILCPNCHALTKNYRAKNIKKV